VKCLQNCSRCRKFHNCYYENEDLYPLRNNVESVFLSLKRVQRLKIRSRIVHMKKKEMGCQIVWYNIWKKLSKLILTHNHLFHTHIWKLYHPFKESIILRLTIRQLMI
jgi:hypothetical protein